MEINFKRFLSFMLALAMVLSYVPVSVFAEETVTDDTSIVSEDVPDEDDSTPVDPDEDNITPVDLDEDDDTTVTEVATYDALIAALADETVTSIKLTADIETSSIISITRSVTIDGNGKTLTYTGSSRAIDVPSSAAGVELAISNLTVKLTASYCERGISFNSANGKLTLTNVDIADETNYPSYAVNLPASADGSLVTITECELYGCIALNIWGSDMVINVVTSTLVSVDKAEAENYAAIKVNNDGTYIAENTIVTVTGGTISALDENGNASVAVSNNVSSSTVTVSETTTIVGAETENENVAILTWDGGSFYSYTSLQDALDTIAEKYTGSMTLKLIADVEEDVTITQKAGANLTIEGNGHTYTGVMTVSGDGKQSGTDTLTIQNINFVAKEGATSCIVSPDKSTLGIYSYSHNVTVSGCTFTDTDGTVGTAAIRHKDGGDKNWTIENCTVDSTMHSLIQTNNVVGKLTITGCTVNSKNGINLNSCTNVEIANNTINVKGYAIRAGVSSGGNLGETKTYVLTGNTLVSACDDGDAVIMLRASAVDMDLTMTQNVVSGETHISGTTEDTTVSADANYWDGASAPVVDGTTVEIETYYIDSELTNLVNVADSTVIEVTTYEELVAALETDNANIKMMNDITGTASQSSDYGVAGIVLNAGDVLDGNGYTLTINDANSTWDCAIAMKGGEVKKLTIAGAFRGIFMPGANGDVVIDKCAFSGVVYTFNSDAGSTDYSVTIKNTTLNGWTSYSAVHGAVSFENCTFTEGSGYAFCRPYQDTTFTRCAFAEGYKFDTSRADADSFAFNGCTYAGEALTAENASDLFYNGGTVVIEGESVNYTITGTVNPVYTDTNSFWGDATTNARTELVIALYEGENVIATASLNDVDNIMDGTTKTVTWHINFATNNDEYWDVTWADGYPNIYMNPDKVVLTVDGKEISNNVVKFSAPDDLNKIVAFAEGYTGGVKAYTTLTDAIGSFNGRTVNVLCDVEESISKMYGCTLTTNVEGGVTITNTYDEYYVYANDLSIGSGVTVEIGNLFFDTDAVNTIEGTLNVAETYYQGYNAKTTVQNGGSVTVGGSVILRYNTNSDAGLYIYGDNNDSTVEFDCAYYIGFYSGTLYAENANIETGYFLLKNSYDSSSYADADMTLNGSTVTVVGTTDTQDSFIIDDQVSLTLTNGSSIEDVRDFSVLSGTNLTLSIDETSSISATNMSIAEDVPFEAVENEDGTYGIQKAVAAEINGTTYSTLQAAIDAANDGDTIELISGENVISMAGSVCGKTVTITGTAIVDWTQGNLWIGREGEGDGKVIFENANITSSVKKYPASYGIHVSGSKKNDSKTNNGTLVIKNSTIELDYLVNRNEVSLENSSLTVYGGYYTHGRNNEESASGNDETATLTIDADSSMTVVHENTMGIGNESYGVMNVYGSYTADQLNVQSNGTVNIYGTVEITGTVKNDGAINLAAADASLTAAEGLNVTSTVTGYDVDYTDGVYTLVKKASADLTYAAYVSDQADRESIKVDIYDVYAETSLVVKLYSNGTPIVTTTLLTVNDEGTQMYPAQGSYTANIVVWGRAAGSWNTVWHVTPSVANIPDTIEVWVDGELMDTWNGGFIKDNEDLYCQLDGVAKAASVTDAEGNTTYFMSLTEALDAANSGETVILLTSTEDTYIIVSPGVTLNLAGHTLTAEKVIGFKGSNVVDNTREGLLKVAEESVIVLSESNSEMAFWTGEGYKFGIFRPVSVAAPVLNEDGSLAFQFYTQISGKLQSLVTDNGTSDNNVSVVIRLTWNTATGTAYQNFVYNDEQVSLVGAGDYSATFTLDNYAELSGLTLTAVIVSETGVEAVAETYQITE